VAGLYSFIYISNNILNWILSWREFNSDRTLVSLTFLYWSDLQTSKYDFEMHQYPLRNWDQFFVPRCKNLFVNRFPLYYFTSCLNELDPALSCIASKNKFKYKLKQHFLDRLSNFECNQLFCYTCSTLVS